MQEGAVGQRLWPEPVPGVSGLRAPGYTHPHRPGRLDTRTGDATRRRDSDVTPVVSLVSVCLPWTRSRCSPLAPSAWLTAEASSPARAWPEGRPGEHAGRGRPHPQSPLCLRGPGEGPPEAMQRGGQAQRDPRHREEGRVAGNSPRGSCAPGRAWIWALHGEGPRCELPQYTAAVTLLPPRLPGTRQESGGNPLAT